MAPSPAGAVAARAGLPEISVDDLVGIPWRHGGRDHRGSDCWGLMVLYFAKHGKRLPDPVRDYAEDWPARGDDLMVRHMPPAWPDAEPPYRIGDLFFLRLQTGGTATHAGVLVHPFDVLHQPLEGTSELVPLRLVLRRVHSVKRPC